jgi:hypothetical protein
MVYTIDLPNGMRDFEFAAYVRMLVRDGVNIADTPRVRDPRTGNRWLHAWVNLDEAERFASRLREDTEDRAWQVYDLAVVEPSTGPLGPLEVVVNRQGDGYTYGMRPTTYSLIRKRFPKSKPVTNVFIATNTSGDIEANQGSIFDQVVKILTGLTDEQIEEFGGSTIYDPTGRVLRGAPAFAH